jgi:acetate kinase
MAETILVLNAGSSSIKFELFARVGEALTPRFDGLIEGIGTSPRFVAKGAGGATIHEERWQEGGEDGGHLGALARLSAWLTPALAGASLLAIGHRVVHGGPDYSAPLLVDDAVLARLEALTSLAPLHQPHNLAGIRAAQRFLPGVPNVACFDTAFHRTQPPVADMFALPQALRDEGIRRYGFHGLSYEYVARQLHEVAPDLARGRVVVAHLGNGASMCAIREGHAVATTMSFTALDGLPMGTRTGQIDPGVLLFLMREKGMDADQLESLLYKQSGLLGISGISNDMRDLEASADPQAALAIDYFVYRIGRELGSLAAAMGGIDGLVFTAGIGENAKGVRARVCQQAAWLGIELDAEANARHGPRISSESSPVSAWVIPTDEEQMIARHVLAVLGA